MTEMQLEDKVREKLNKLIKSMIVLINNGDLFELMPSMVILFEVNTGTIIKANKRFLDYLGYEEKDVVGKTFFDFIAPEDIERTHEAWENFRNGHLPTLFFLNHYRTKEGNYKPMYWVRENANKTGLNEYGFTFAFPELTLK